MSITGNAAVATIAEEQNASTASARAPVLRVYLALIGLVILSLADGATTPLVADSHYNNFPQ